MFVEELEKIKCSGCWACFNVCPVNAIEMKQDEEGFKYPLIVEEKCIKCSKCEEVCPSLKIVKNSNSIDPKVFAAWSLDKDTRIKSTSGGVFSELAKQVLEDSGYICGAIYNKENMVEHFICNNKEGLDKIRQSKYVQSDVGYVFQVIEKKLKENHKVLFCGTPCECGGLINYLESVGAHIDNLIIVDFICRGSNSPKVYDMFLKELENEYGSKVKKVWFKNKTYGWNRFSTFIEFENGKEYLKDRYSDLFIRGYIEKNLYIRPSCSYCLFKGVPRMGDITLGDFWGIEMKDSTKDTDKGTSVIMLNSLKGEKIFEKIKTRLFFEEKTIDEVSKNNVHLNKSIEQGTERSEFMKQLNNINVSNNIKLFLR